jgi:hypothetical protein
VKRVLFIVCCVVGGLFLIEIAIPGHFALLEAYFTGVGNLIGVRVGS